ncbi:MAG: hypothetical protein MK538_08730 [Planctomycetes bacterium]|nr:hypothetical protein [Planctomycetota bacterium]
MAQEPSLVNYFQRNRRFLLIVGAGLAIFMTLNSLVSAYIGRAASLLEGANDFAEKSRKLKEELKGQYHETKERIEEYEKFETALRRDLELPEIRQAKNLDKNSMLVQFNQATEDVWGELRTIANRRGVELPDRLKLRDFGHEPTDGPTEFRRYYDYLAIVRRSLIATLESGVAEIQRIELVPGDLLTVPGDDDSRVLVRSVRFRVIGGFESFVDVLTSVQTSGDFLQVQVERLGVNERSDDGSLRGDLRFSGLRLWRVGEEGVGIGPDQVSKKSKRRRSNR